MRVIKTKKFFITRTNHVFDDKDLFLSMDHMESFSELGMKFSCVRQYISWRKAIMFGDYRAAVLITRAQTPKEMVKHGRSVMGFDDNIWRQHRKAIAIQAYSLKYAQNESGKKFAELERGSFFYASKNEYWGTGLTVSIDDNVNESKFNGENLLGEVLTEVQKKIKSIRR